VNFGYPISEIERIGFGFGLSNISIETGSQAVQEIISSPVPIDNVDFVLDESAVEGCTDTTTADDVDPTDCLASNNDFSDYDPAADYNTFNPAGWINENGDDFNIATLNFNWRQSTLNRGRLATRGASQSFAAELSLPGGDLEYFKLTYNAQYFRPLTESLTLRLRTKLGYANSFGDTTELPFFENFYSGGFGSVRGFKRNTLGPRATPAEQYSRTFFDSNNDGAIDGDDELAYINDADGLRTERASSDDDPFGGNILVEGSAEILFPLPFIKDQRSMQSALFLDMGNVFDDSCGESQLNCQGASLGELSSAVGVGLTWITGFGPLTFSIAKPINQNEYDKTEFFQFSLGSSF